MLIFHLSPFKIENAKATLDAWIDHSKYGAKTISRGRFKKLEVFHFQAF